MQLDFFPYGAQFFRPPNPPRKDWKRDLQQLVDHNFNIIKIWPMWTWIHTAPDTFDFSEIDEVMDLAHSMGLKVVINTILENSPYWMEEKYPEARYQTADGFAFALQPRSNTAVGGWPGLCLDHPEVRKEGAKFLSQIASRYADHPALFAYDVWNEPHLEPAAMAFKAPEERNLYCYCDSTIADFRRWLEKRYGSLEELCKRWVHRYTSWSQVNPPRRRECYQDMIDWRLYMSENLASQMAWRVEQIRKHDDKHLVMTHVWGPMCTNSLAHASIDPWKLAAPVQMFGCSIFPRWWWGQSHDALRFAFHLDGSMAGSKGKPYWISELQGGCGQGLFDGIRRPPTPTPEEIWQWNWMGLAHGMKGLMYWQWRSERLGTEAPGFGLLNVAGEPTERAPVAKRVATIIKEHEDLFLKAEPSKKEIAIAQDPHSQILNFAAEGDNRFYFESCSGYYRALWEANIPVDFLHTELEIDKGDFADARLLILPLPQAMKQQTAEKLKEFVANGGILWADACPAHYDELGRCSEIVPGWGLDELFGAREKGVYVEEEHLDMETEVSGLLGWRKPRSVRGHLYAETLEPTDGEVVGRWKGQPVIVCKRHGKGIAILNGTYFGISLAREFHQPTADMFLDVVRQAGIQSPLVLSASNIKGCVLEEEGYKLVFLFNLTEEPRETDVEVRGIEPKRAKEIISGEKVAIEQGRMTASLPAGSVQVIHIE
ncbi:MAG: cellulase family glycosylhydrolase [Armatimonadetes bacterium]|nr:cellulase family glycosylhydrolase [Armatimonadota bacterium]NIM24094.1 cellulase family glycosylhydrolase [Armatimonadota bacterium]NIM67948.1 cellulase family glycosylhydrolase [Armatimonadota bacterium]NIM76470.1 cellulase family glycosylhydrolase [Armatimonadota bacterium]NIN06178.1 cellulase family glycosylhydrolase [Armatimonadota bacterium]